MYKRSSEAGIALVIALAMIVLLSIVVLAFMSSVKTDLASAQDYQNEASSRDLANSAVNLVIGQIREGSTQPNKAWISQPGLVRTYNLDGTQDKAYKLYSAAIMTDSTGSFDPADPAKSDLPTITDRSNAQHWSQQPALWTDLNAPVEDTTRIDTVTKRPLLSFPVLDGNHFNTKGELALDSTNRSIEGFWIDEYDKRKVEMPVRWIYILKDGSLAPASATIPLVGHKVNVPTATAANPIVARMAFWTDDDTAKVNINTASEGTFADTPVCNTQPGLTTLLETTYKTNTDYLYEWDLAERQGAASEYQRYPGHPATTCLSTVFGLEIARANNWTIAETLSTKRDLFIEEFMKIAPRVAGKNYAATPVIDYSSRGGIIRAGSDNTGKHQLQADASQRNVTKDNDRLYANPDELAYQAPATPPAALTGDRINSPLAKLNGVDATQEMLEMAKFFITASSKAPEQNLFNLPRMAIWPIRFDATKRTGYDKLAYFCANIKNPDPTKEFPIIFQREWPMSQTDDYIKIANNQRLYQYLINQTNRTSQVLTPRAATAPKSFATKYGIDQPQIITEILDYIRCANLVDNSNPAVNSAYTNPTIGDALLGGMPTTNSASSARGQVLPLVINGTRGIGRIATISELAILFHKKSDMMANGLSIYHDSTYNAGGPPLYNPGSPATPSLPKDYPTTYGPVKTVAEQSAVIPPNPVTYNITGTYGANVPPSPWPNFVRPPNQSTFTSARNGSLVNQASIPATIPWDWKTQYCFEAVLLPDLFCPMAGYSSLAHNLRINFSNFKIMVGALDGAGTVVSAPKDIFTLPPPGQPDLFSAGRLTNSNTWSMENGTSKIGGNIGIGVMAESVFTGNPRNSGAPTTKDSGAVAGNASTEDSAPPNAEFTIPRTATVLTLSGSVTVKIYSPYNALALDPSAKPIQTIVFNFPATSITINKTDWTPKAPFPSTNPPATANAPNAWAGNNYPPCIENEWMVGGSGSRAKGDRLWRPDGQPARAGSPVTRLLNQVAFSPPNGMKYTDWWYDCRHDYLRSSTAVNAESVGTKWNGDLRLVAASDTIKNVFGAIDTPAVAPFNTAATKPYMRRDYQMAHSMTGPQASRFDNSANTTGNLVAAMPFNGTNDQDGTCRPTVPPGLTAALNSLGKSADWDNGPAWMNDGALCNKPDEGAPRSYAAGNVITAGNIYTNPQSYAEIAAPYIGYHASYNDMGDQSFTFFSPNRQIASPVTFGSLPTGVKRGLPWQTLLFRPTKAYLPGGTTHPGSDVSGPPDHLLLDLFWMPVVEPYAVSEPFATAGKINLNNQVVPFTNIKRNTGLHAVLKPVKITALNPTQPTNAGVGAKQQLLGNYKTSGTFNLRWINNASGYLNEGTGNYNFADGGGWGVSVRRNLDVGNTVRLISDRLARNQPFLSASEICDIPLIPADMSKPPEATFPLYNPGFIPITGPESLMAPAPTPLGSFDAMLSTFWGNHLLTGDNSLERPYSMIYPRLTTRSNTYTVHVRVQSLRKAKGGGNLPTVFDETKDPVASEFRGSFVLDRYLDPNTGGFVDATGAPTTETDANAVLGPYRFRVISSKQFSQ